MNAIFRARAIFVRMTLSALLALPTFCALLPCARAHGGGISATPETPLTSLIALTSQRLALAEPLARGKWASHRPVTDARDAPRERALLADVQKRATAAGVSPAFAKTFFADQIDASKTLQNAWFASWRHAPPPAHPSNDDVQPQLDRLTRQLIVGLARVEPLRAAPDCPVRMAQALANWKTLMRYDPAQADALTQALQHVCTSGGIGGIA